MIQTIQHKGHSYPAFQASGNAARFCREFAKEVCIGKGVDVGAHKKEWAFPGAYCIDPVLNGYDALNFPDECIELDYIHSSHCAEHLPNWVEALDYWHSRLKSGAVVFLYLPDHSQTYWRGWCNRKHLHMLTPEIVGNYFKDQPEMWKNVFVSGVDLNNSFAVMAEKV